MLWLVHEIPLKESKKSVWIPFLFHSLSLSLFSRDLQAGREERGMEFIITKFFCSKKYFRWTESNNNSRKKSFNVCLQLKLFCVVSFRELWLKIKLFPFLQRAAKSFLSRNTHTLSERCCVLTRNGNKSCLHLAAGVWLYENGWMLCYHCLCESHTTENIEIHAFIFFPRQQKKIFVLKICQLNV